VVETVKRRVQPYFVLEGNICALLTAKDQVNMFLYEAGIVPDPEGIITAGRGNKTARTKRCSNRIIANNRAGGWRWLKASEVLPTAASWRWAVSASP
jgi:hypothetical protein